MRFSISIWTKKQTWTEWAVFAGEKKTSPLKRDYSTPVFMKNANFSTFAYCPILLVKLFIQFIWYGIFHAFTKRFHAMRTFYQFIAHKLESVKWMCSGLRCGKINACLTIPSLYFLWCGFRSFIVEMDIGSSDYGEKSWHRKPGKKSYKKKMLKILFNCKWLKTGKKKNTKIRLSNDGLKVNKKKVIRTGKQLPHEDC